MSRAFNHSSIRAGRSITLAAAVTCLWLAVLPCPSQAQTVRDVVINRQRLSTAQVETLERTHHIPIRNGRYWYDRVSGLWGHEGGPTMGQVAPGLQLGGPLAADISTSAATGMFLNGRALHPVELAHLATCGLAAPGRFWLAADGRVGFEGSAPLGNLGAALAQCQGTAQTPRTPPARAGATPGIRVVVGGGLAGIQGPNGMSANCGPDGGCFIMDRRRD